MRRRALLGALGTAAAAASAGYVSGFTPDGRTNRSENGTSSGDDAAYRRWFVGTRSGVERPADNLPHDVLVRNATPLRRTVTVEVGNRTADERILRESVRLPVDGEAVVELLTPAIYGVTVQDRLTGRSTGFEVARDWFDCNSSSTTAKLDPFGGVAVTFGSTLVYCDAEQPKPGQQ